MPQSAIINVMTAAARKASEKLLRDFSEAGNLRVTRKATNDFVTAADIRTERILHEDLLRARPKFGCLMEEKGEVPGEDKTMRWVIDPVDGTTNFIHTIPYFCISIALEKTLYDGTGEIQAGVIYDPVHDEMFTAEKNEGTFLNGRRVRMSDRGQLEEALLVTAPLHQEREEYHASVAMLKAVSMQQAVVRTAGATALDLAYIAAGRYDGGWYNSFQRWDIAAGMLMVREAGGTVSEIGKGGANPLDGNTLVAANTSLHPKLNNLLQQG